MTITITTIDAIYAVQALDCDADEYAETAKCAIKGGRTESGTYMTIAALTRRGAAARLRRELERDD